MSTQSSVTWTCCYSTWIQCAAGTIIDFFFSSRRRHTRSVSAFLLNRSSDLTFKRPVSSWKALNLRKTLLMASSVRLKPLNCSRLPCVYAQETLTFLLTQKKTCVKNYVQKE